MKQKYQFADVFIRWNDDDKLGITSLEQRTVSLSEQCDENDERIFFHFKNYEEFIEFVAYAGNTEDFHVVSILELY